MSKATSGLFLPESDTTSSSETGDASGKRRRKTFVQWLQEQPHGESLLATIPAAFIDDDFNLVDVEEQVPAEMRDADYIDDLLVMLQGRAPSEWQLKDEPTLQMIRHATLLYCVIHQRFLQTRPGQQAMESVIEGAGRVPCRRVLCEGTAMLPMGESSQAGAGPVRFWCPSCQEAYAVGTGTSVTLDGAAFGPSFPLLYLMSYKSRTANDLPILPPSAALGTKRVAVYEPRVFGFRVRPGIASYRGVHHQA